MTYSAIIRTFNHSALVAETVASLKQQSKPPHSIIIVDSGSSAVEKEIISRLADQFIDISFRQFNYSFAINIAAFNCKSDYVLIISSHVKIMLHTALESLITELEASPQHAAAFIVNPESRSTTVCNTPEWMAQTINQDSFTGRNGLTNSCSLIRRHDLLCQPFREDVWAAEDQAWTLEMIRKGKTLLRISSCYLIYKNPNLNQKKRINEHLAIATFVNKNESSFLSILNQAMKSLKWAIRGNMTKSSAHRQIFIGLLLLRIKIHSPQSRYFK